MSDCRVYWGSHGCDLSRGHDGLHVCNCCAHGTLAEHIAREGMFVEDGEEFLCVATWPYYGDETSMWGEDAPNSIPA